MARSAAPTATARFDRLDALRGLALVWMAIFHFCFDLSHYGFIDANFYSDPLWTVQRTGILSLFLLCAGAGQAIAAVQQQSWARFGKRWAQIVGCALLVSLSSYWMFPRSYIYFGVLHGMAVMLLLLRLTRAWPWLWLPLGAVAIVLPQIVQLPFFDARATSWIGLVTHKPITEDFVPVLPWIGVMGWGLVLTHYLLRVNPRLLGTQAPHRRFGPWRALAWLGRWSLSFYMLHQPVLIGGLELARLMRA